MRLLVNSQLPGQQCCQRLLPLQGNTNCGRRGGGRDGTGHTPSRPQVGRNSTPITVPILISPLSCTMERVGERAKNRWPLQEASSLVAFLLPSPEHCAQGFCPPQILIGLELEDSYLRIWIAIYRQGRTATVSKTCLASFSAYVIFSCVCKPGYEGDGVTCSEVDPCANLIPHGCNTNVSLQCLIYVFAV